MSRTVYPMGEYYCYTLVVSFSIKIRKKQQVQLTRTFHLYSPKHSKPSHRQAVDPIVTRLYKSYVRSRQMPTEGSCEALASGESLGDGWRKRFVEVM